MMPLNVYTRPLFFTDVPYSWLFSPAIDLRWHHGSFIDGSLPPKSVRSSTNVHRQLCTQSIQQSELSAFPALEDSTCSILDINRREVGGYTWRLGVAADVASNLLASSSGLTPSSTLPAAMPPNTTLSSKNSKRVSSSKGRLECLEVDLADLTTVKTAVEQSIQRREVACSHK
jgi:hypothetical protein